MPKKSNRRRPANGLEQASSESIAALRDTAKNLENSIKQVEASARNLRRTSHEIEAGIHQTEHGIGDRGVIASPAYSVKHARKRR